MSVSGKKSEMIERHNSVLGTYWVDFEAFAKGKEFHFGHRFAILTEHTERYTRH